MPLFLPTVEWVKEALRERRAQSHHYRQADAPGVLFGPGAQAVAYGRTQGAWWYGTDDGLSAFSRASIPLRPG